ncbi:MAG: aldo/keto reductase [Planctomycetota bacterium]
MSDSRVVRWGVLGAGAIAKAFVQGITALDCASVTGIGSRSLEKAKVFADDAGLTGATCHGSYEALLAAPDIDAVYIATPHPMHAHWAIRAAEAGKHILCEKPVALNHAEAMAVVEAARAHGVFFMEAFKDRCHPQTAKLLKLLGDNAIGEVRTVRVEFGFNAEDWGGVDPESRLFSPQLGGGGILDVGCYAVEMARLIAGAASDKPFLDPIEVKAVGTLGATGVDEWTAAVLLFDNGVVAQVATGIRAALENGCHIVGSTGSITLPDPWLNSREDAETGRIIVQNADGKQEIEIACEHNGFGYEAEVASRAILAGKTAADTPAMTPADTLGQMKTLDAWRAQLKLSYPQETPGGFPMPLSGRPAGPRDGHPMTYGRIPGLDRDLSNFVIGCDNQLTFPHAAVMFDHWLEVGGNAFDTAHLYMGGEPERLFGHWQTSRGVRDQINIIAKGAHTPHCNPESVTRQLHISLERMQTDHAEIYILHRDNPDVPVDEFVDVLHEHAEAGRIGVFGGSNWSVERYVAANEYAKAHGKRGFSLMSNNFSLARMINPVWDGCVAASVPETRQFLIDNQVPNLAWSSQARGYFVSKEATGRAGEWDHDNAWDSPENRQRRQRAFELAEKHGVTAINIAAAYVLCQPFPSFALIGPRQIHETVTSLPALGLQLTESEMAYLDLRD